MQLSSDAIYHIYNRGVEKRDIFAEERDYLRFLNDLFEFNDTRPATASNLRLNSRYPGQHSSRLEVGPLNTGKERERLVDIFAFCLMPNHFHFLMQQKKEGGITKFMQKLGTGYAGYFNKKYRRVGGLFQGRFKSVLIERDAHFLHIPNYIHANPLGIIMPDWKNGEVNDPTQAIAYLANYRWSSFADYIGKENFPALTQRDFLLEIFRGQESYKRNMTEWIAKAPVHGIESLTLE